MKIPLGTTVWVVFAISQWDTVELRTIIDGKPVTIRPVSVAPGCIGFVPIFEDPETAELYREQHPAPMYALSTGEPEAGPRDDSKN